MSNHNQFLLTQRACIELYPPVLHQAALLSTFGEVTIVDTLTESDDSQVQTKANIRRVRVTAKDSSSTVLPIIGRFRNLRRYSRILSQQMATRAASMIAFEPEAVRIMLRSGAKQRKRIVHLHEIPAWEAYAESRSGTTALAYMMKNLDRVDAVVVPDSGRADYLQEMAGLKLKPLVVMNCPRRLTKLPQSLLIPFLRKRGINSTRIVHYQGAVGPDHKLETVIRSMRFWPDDSIFVVVGAGREWYLKELAELVIAQGLEERVVFLGRIPYNQLFQYAIGAAVGVTLLDTSGLNTRFCAGASNKRFEYAALGIPQVTNEGFGIQDLFGNTGIAAIANHDDIAMVGNKISHYLRREASAREAGAKARALHLQSYNYEHQFQKVLDVIC